MMSKKQFPSVLAFGYDMGASNLVQNREIYYGKLEYLNTV